MIGEAKSILSPDLIGVASDVELLHRVLQVVGVQDHADAAGDRRRMGDDLIGGGGQVIRSAGADVEQAGHHRQVRATFEDVQIVPHDVGGRHAAAGAIDPQHDAPHARIAGNRIEPFAKHRHGILARRAEAGEIGVQQQAIDVDNARSPVRRAAPRTRARRFHAAARNCPPKAFRA